MRLNMRVIAGLAAVAVGVLLFAPRLAGAALPLLLVAACPLSMIFMMRGMGGMQGRAKDLSSTDGQDQHDVGSVDPRAAEVRELQEEVNRLRAEVQLQSQKRTS